MRGIYRTKFSVRDSLAHQLPNARENRLNIVFDHFVDVRRLAFARPHHLTLHQPRIDLVGSNEIEIGANVSHHFFARRQVAIEHTEYSSFQTGKSLIQHRGVKRFFVLEVVVEQSLVHPGLTRNGVGAGSGDAVFGKLLRGGLQDGGTALLGLSTGTHARRAQAAGMKESRH